MQTYKVFSKLESGPVDTVADGTPCRAVLLEGAGTFTLLAANGITFDYSVPTGSSAIVPIAVKRILTIPGGGSVVVLN